MGGPVRERQPSVVFGKRREPHTIIIARGERIRHFTVRPWMPAAGIIAAGIVMAAVALSTTNFFFHDDLLATAITREADMRQGYEERIAALRAELDRVTSRQLLDQQVVEKKVGELLRRQAELEQRHEIMAPIVKRANVDEPALPVPSPRPDRAAQADTLQLRGAHDVPGLTAYADDAARTVPWPLRGRDESTPREETVSSLESVGRALQAIATEQVDRIGTLTETAYAAADAISDALRAAGLGPRSVDEEDVGGPYVPPNGAAAFDTRVQELDDALDELEELKKEARGLPLRNPAPGRVVTSSFGVRRDPMLDKPAFHGGMDFRVAYGTPVRATAPGTVVHAGWAGGYGRMVEIDNGSGITTRFGHLSKISVARGDTVETGDLLGKSGSSGRSTGPHLHYEIREDGKPVNPATFLKAGRRISRYL